MRIAQVSPLYESVPPRQYGGTERIVSYLTEELTRRGHDVTLFASGDSETAARLVPCCGGALRLDRCRDPLAHHYVMAERVLQMSDEFDVIHNHNDYLPFAHLRRIPTPSVTTLHGRLDIPDLAPLYAEFDEMPLVSISRSQRQPLAGARWVGTVHHGIPSSRYSPGAGNGGYLAFLGRISIEKRVDDAIEIAKRTSMPLRIAAKIDNADFEYYYGIRHLLSHPLVDFIGEIGEKDKQDFLGGAAALLFPIDWPEPFGLVMIEAMACGTPVIARRRGSVPEVVEDGVTGFVFDEIDEAVRAVPRAIALDRRRVRAEFERRFTDTRMAEEYLKIYGEIISAKQGDTRLWLKTPDKTSGSQARPALPTATGFTSRPARRSSTSASAS